MPPPDDGGRPVELSSNAENCRVPDARLAGDHDTAAQRYRAAAADAERIGYEAGRATALRELASNDRP